MATHVPRVSVCVPSYNHSRFLAQTLDSILSQTYLDLEIIIVDDGSTDNSFEIAQRYQSEHPSKIRLYTHANNQNLGTSETVNAAFAKVRGEYWMGLPSDDLLHPNKIERQVQFLDQHKDIGWVYSYANYIDDTGELLQGLFGEDISRDAAPVEAMIRGNRVPGMTALMRRSISEKVGLHDASLVYSDWHYWVRMTAAAKVGFINEPLVYYRVHGSNTSIGVDRDINLARFVEVTQAIRRDADEGRLSVGKRARALIELQLAYYNLCRDNESAAELCFGSALKFYPDLIYDQNYLRDWISERCDFSRGILRKPEQPSNLVRWLIGRVQATISRPKLQSLEAEYLAQAAIDTSKTDRGNAVRFAFKSVITDSSQLTNKRLYRAILKGIAGEKAVEKLRRLKRR